MQIQDYNYDLPEKFIAQKPASPRDSAKLMVYDTKSNKVYFDTFLHLDKYLSRQSVLVFNNTKVVPARVRLKKESGGVVELLLLLNERRPGEKRIKGLSDRKITIGQKLWFDNKNYLEVVNQDEKIFYFEAFWIPASAGMTGKGNAMTDATLYKLLDQHGHMPIPKYIRHNEMPESELREKYQTVFAKTPASVAAPTASLHFTERLMSKLKRNKVEEVFVTLHVGMGTFAPVDEANFKSRKLFTERIEVPIVSAQKINAGKAKNHPIIAVGTTAMRTLESASNTKGVMPKSGETDIFIFPPYDFKVADGLITNFHLPKSSLMMLVEAFLQYKGARRGVVELYEVAKTRGFKFYSFGDGMLIL